jgi:GT2 family glycosyltransferase
MMGIVTRGTIRATMASEPRVAIVIVNWNGRALTLECLRSLRWIVSPQVQLIVVDNGSTDGSLEGIRETSPEMTLIALGENRRFAGGNNAGIRQALRDGAEMVLLLNNDTIVDPDFLHFMVERMDSDSRCGMVAPKILYETDRRRIWYAGGCISFWTGTLRHVGIREIDHGQYDTPRSIEYATGCCVLVKREVIEHIGMLDESFFMYGEDADWSLRAGGAGYTLLYEPRAVIWHKVSVSAGGHLSWYKLRHKFASNLRLIGRYASWYHWFVFPWMNILVNGFSAFRYLLKAPRSQRREKGNH